MTCLKTVKMKKQVRLCVQFRLSLHLKSDRIKAVGEETHSLLLYLLCNEYKSLEITAESSLSNLIPEFGSASPESMSCDHSANSSCSYAFRTSSSSSEKHRKALNPERSVSSASAMQMESST